MRSKILEIFSILIFLIVLFFFIISQIQTTQTKQPQASIVSQQENKMQEETLENIAPQEVLSVSNTPVYKIG